MHHVNNPSFVSFLETYKRKLTELFTERNNEGLMSAQRGLPPYVLRQILECNPLATFIPEEYGGRGAKTHETLSMLEVSSYQSLPLSLMMGINGALFLQPLANYGNEDVKKKIFRDFLVGKNMGGLMITEPNFGSEALKMQTGFLRSGKHYSVSGLKHWAGLTGWADYWLITARERDGLGNLGKDIGFFIHDTSNGGIEVEEVFQNLGLYMLPYGRNRVEIQVPESHRLQPKTTGITMMLDLLHRSRLQFPGMATGFLRRMLDEAVHHCKTRNVGGTSLFNYDQVKERLAQLQSWFTVSSAMSYFTSSNVPLEKDTSRSDLPANSIKSVVTDYMQSAAQHLLQLVGAKGYKLDHIAGRSVVDSRPFQIFEGSNDILYQQITESVLKMMRKMPSANLYDFLKDYTYTEKAADYFKDILNFRIDYGMAQRKMVELGQAISRMVSMNMTMDLGEKGFNQEMVSNSLAVLQKEIRMILSGYSFNNNAGIAYDPEGENNWLNYLPLRSEVRQGAG
ncbi:MAG: acyl-CoA dehydrogenase [Bacteroidetes bacterium]|nr:MAG: acyl-CoA dehydrogenase [Bacteroidota bacterium]